jgi:hypothetical protein
MKKSVLWRWGIGALIVTAIDLLAILCDADQFEHKSAYSSTEWVVGIVGHITFLLDVPMLAVRALIEGDPWSTFGFHLPFSIVDAADRWTYSVCRSVEDIAICFVFFILWEAASYVWRLFRSKNPVSTKN